MVSKEVFERVSEQVQDVLAGSGGCHDWDHTNRVCRIALKLAEEEGDADLEVIRLAAILHDVSRPVQDRSKGEICHAEHGAVVADDILSKLDIDPDTRSKVCHCVRTHRARGSAQPESKEAKIIYDADKLDAIGAVGIGRAFLFAGEVGAKLHNHDIDIMATDAYSDEDTAYREFMHKLRHVKDKMKTASGMKLAEDRHEFMTAFFERLSSEVDGDL